MTRRDHEQRPHRDRSFAGFRLRRLDLIHAGATFLRRRGLEHAAIGGILVHRLAAAWCPVHGDCTCPVYGLGVDVDPEERHLDAPTCPLHSPTSTHPEEP